MNSERIVIDILANDKASQVVSNVSNSFNRLQKNTSNLKMPNMSKLTTPNLSGVNNLSSKMGENINHVNNLTDSTNNLGDATGKVNNSLGDLGDKGSKSVDNINKGANVGITAFHNMNTILMTVSSGFSNLGNMVTGIFGVMGISGMIEKMWSRAAERQSNMLYLMHQRGVDEANSFYTEIMNIVTELPGDDTFLTNILNQASAMDTNLPIEKVRDLGSAVTDLYIASKMKGERPDEIQRDLRKYVLTGETRPMRNSVLASEIDLLKHKNTVEERSLALQKALKNTGYIGMSNYESATNELEEFKGRFEKAFADVGTVITIVVQPLMKFYNMLDGIFGGRISQIIIVLTASFVALTTAIAGAALLIPFVTRPFEVLGGGVDVVLKMAAAINSETASYTFLDVVLIHTLGLKTEEIGLSNAAIFGKVSEALATLKLAATEQLRNTITNISGEGLSKLININLKSIGTKLLNIKTTIQEIIFGVENIKLKEAELIAYSAEVGAKIDVIELKSAYNTLSIQEIHVNLYNIKTKIADTFATIQRTIVIYLSTDASLAEARTEAMSAGAKQMNRAQTNRNILAEVRYAFAKIKNVIAGKLKIVQEKLEVVWSAIVSFATDSQTRAKVWNTIVTNIQTIATMGLAAAQAVLNAELLPFYIIILVVVGAVLLLVKGFEALGQAFGWWDNLSNMFKAIGDGLGRIWNAFVNSDIIQGIIGYFTDFIDVLKYVWDTLANLFSLLTGGGGNGEFDIVQSIIDLFGALGDAVKWVWGLIDGFANSPFGIITWLNPIGILLFHLDELGSLFEDIGDAINQFVETDEFEALTESIKEVGEILYEPFQILMELFDEVQQMFSELFSGDETEGSGTAERVNFLLEVLKSISFVLRYTLLPMVKLVVRVFATSLKIILTPLYVILFVIKSIGNAIKWASEVLNGFGNVWQLIISPITIVYNIFKSIWDTVTGIVDTIKNSIIGKLLGWDKEEDKDKSESGDSNSKVATNLYSGMKDNVLNSDMDWGKKHQILSELDKQNNMNNVNEVRNLGSTYNHHDNQKQIIINQNFGENSIPVDARNMTHKEARKLFVGAFGYNRAVGSKGILR